jgi:hypothetical protein
VSGSIVSEAALVGDDGIRAAIVSNLSPLPRTSEDCDSAAQAFLYDRVGTFYNGTYTCTSLFFQGLTSDQQFYPTVGRFLNVNAPRRGISGQRFLVTQLSISVLEATTEILQYQISFGADLHLQKTLFNFVDIQPKNVLVPADTCNPPNPRYTVNVDDSFLPDLSNVQVDLQHITPTSALVRVYDSYYGPIEARQVDNNWGRGNTPDFLGIFYGPEFTLNRNQYDQVWFLRPVSGGMGSAPPVVAVTGGMVGNSTPGIPYVASRRSKVLRIAWPQRPVAPSFIGVTAIQAPAITAPLPAVTGYPAQVATQVMPQLIGDSTLTYFNTIWVTTAADTSTLFPYATLTIAGCTGSSIAMNGLWTVQGTYSNGTVIALTANVPLTTVTAAYPGLTWKQSGTPTTMSQTPQTISTYAVQLNYNGDQRNIYGLEVRAADNKTILLQRPVASYTDLYVDLSQTSFLFLPYPLNGDYSLYCYFFNQQYDYSPPLILDIESLPSVRNPYIWSPGGTAPTVAEALWQADNFAIETAYVTLADGTPAGATEAIFGVPIINAISPTLGPPVIMSIVVSSGGYVNPGIYEVAMTQFDADYNSTDLSDTMNVIVTSSGSMLTINLLQSLPANGGEVFMASPSSDSGWHDQTLTVPLPGATTVQVQYYEANTAGTVDPEVVNYTVQYKQLWHAGILGAQVQAISASGLTFACASGCFANDALNGRIVSVLAKWAPAKIPFLNLLVTSCTGYGNYNTLGFANCGTGGGKLNLITKLAIGDVIVVRSQATTVTSSSVTDSLWANPSFSLSGLDNATETARLAWVIYGTDAGDVQQITSITASGTTINIAGTWQVKPDATSIIVIVDPQWEPLFTTQSYTAANPSLVAVQIAEPKALNLASSQWIFRVLPTNIDGFYTDNQWVRLREVFVFGSQGTRRVTS